MMADHSVSIVDGSNEVPSAGCNEVDNNFVLPQTRHLLTSLLEPSCASEMVVLKVWLSLSGRPARLQMLLTTSAMSDQLHVKLHSIDRDIQHRVVESQQA